MGTKTAWVHCSSVAWRRGRGPGGAGAAQLQRVWVPEKLRSVWETACRGHSSDWPAPGQSQCGCLCSARRSWGLEPPSAAGPGRTSLSRSASSRPPGTLRGGRQQTGTTRAGLTPRSPGAGQERGLGRLFLRQGHGPAVISAAGLLRGQSRGHGGRSPRQMLDSGRAGPRRECPGAAEGHRLAAAGPHVRPARPGDAVRGVSAPTSPFFICGMGP